MKKQLFSLALVVALLLLCACKAEPQSPTEPEETQPESSTAGNVAVTDSIFDDAPESENSQPVQTTPVESESSEAPETEPDADIVDSDTGMTYERFIAMSPKEQREYQQSYADMEAFFQWYETAKAKYEEEHPSTIIGGDGVVVLP